MNIGLDAPIVAGVEQRRVFVKHATVPTAHLVVGVFIAVLDVLFFEYFGGFFKEVVVDPGGDGPMFFGDEFWGEISRRGGRGKEGEAHRSYILLWCLLESSA